MSAASSTAFSGARCGYCGVIHLGADGKPVICPLLRPQPQPQPQSPIPFAPKFCPHCGGKL